MFDALKLKIGRFMTRDPNWQPLTDVKGKDVAYYRRLFDDAKATGNVAAVEDALRDVNNAFKYGISYYSAPADWWDLQDVRKSMQQWSEAQDGFDQA